MKLVVGLGNPGRKYEGTRHNVGYDVVNHLARRHAQGSPRAAFHGEVLEANLNGERALLLCPHTYMNRSGSSVVAARDFYKLDDEDLLIVCDDFHLPLGQLRVRAQGSAGGQKGLADIIRCLGTDRVPRLRFGIGEPPPRWDAADFVLSKFTAEESTDVQLSVERAADAVLTWARDGIQTCMNQVN